MNSEADPDRSHLTLPPPEQLLGRWWKVDLRGLSPAVIGHVHVPWQAVAGLILLVFVGTGLVVGGADSSGFSLGAALGAALAAGVAFYAYRAASEGLFLTRSQLRLRTARTLDLAWDHVDSFSVKQDGSEHLLVLVTCAGAELKIPNTQRLGLSRRLRPRHAQDQEALAGYLSELQDQLTSLPPAEPGQLEQQQRVNRADATGHVVSAAAALGALVVFRTAGILAGLLALGGALVVMILTVLVSRRAHATMKHGPLH